MTVALRRLLVVAAAFVLLGHGGVELAPRLATAGASVAAFSGATPTTGRSATQSPPGEHSLALRISLPAAVPAGVSDTVSGPAPARLVARHLVARPLVRPPSPTRVQDVVTGASGRAPPAPAGT